MALTYFHWAPSGEEACTRCLPLSAVETDELLSALSGAGYASRLVARFGKRLETWWLDGRFAETLVELGLPFCADVAEHLQAGHKARLWRKVQHRPFRRRLPPTSGTSPRVGDRRRP